MLQKLGKRPAEQLEHNSSALPNPVLSGKLVLCCKFELQKLPIKLPKFYEECLKGFAKCSAANRGSVKDLNGNDLAKKLFFGTISLFVWEASLCISKKLAEKGIVKIGDLISDNNELVAKNDRKLRELNILPLHALRLSALIDASPLDWRISYIEGESF